MQSKFIRTLALAPLFYCGAALAHPGHEGGLLAGLAHPFSGLDHMLAAVAVGIWAAQLGGRARWLLPLSFIALLAAGGMMGMAGVGIAALESAIIASVLVLGLSIAFKVKLMPALGALMVGAFAVVHGLAHGAEMPHVGSAGMYFSGILASSAVLLAGGMAAGAVLRQQQAWLRGVGAVIALGGVWIGAAF
ncbi:urease accessory protein UreJ [Massilia sp. CCM 8733]|uniref:Urease accessory protein UreJ n=1 Tax=Massilia mucilaginosa TaxID=2609282 RepID=A0ABX0NLN1_9BURK|nr:HupE/UreJ family protein [Massilia mucilaginosa]NHZ87719.1 urease accessory protein UreJ [Massilia mucilaginosa]